MTAFSATHSSDAYTFRLIHRMLMPWLPRLSIDC